LCRDLVYGLPQQNHVAIKIIRILTPMTNMNPVDGRRLILLSKPCKDRISRSSAMVYKTRSLQYVDDLVEGMIRDGSEPEF
jgi:hypothetical protein